MRDGVNYFIVLGNKVMNTPSSRPADQWSREQATLIIKMTRLLRARGFEINFMERGLYVRLLQLSADVEDADVADVRAQLLRVAPPECLEALALTLEATSLPIDDQTVEPSVHEPCMPTVVELFPHDVCAEPFACPSCQCVLPMPRIWPRARNAKPFACPCGQMFRLRPNTRKFRRKRVNLAGYCAGTADVSSPQVIIVCDLSYGGIQFRLPGPHDLRVGMPLQVHFTLPDNADRKIQQTIYVRHIKGRMVGASWDETAPFAHALALFLMQ